MSTQLRKVLIYAGVWSFILIGFYFLIWSPRLKRLDKLQKDMKVQQNVMNQLERDVRAFPETITFIELQRVESNLEQVLARIPSEEEVYAILKQIQEYGMQKANLHISRITDITQEWRKGRRSAAQTASIPKVTYQITAQGNAQNVIQFLHEIENGVRLITVEDFVLRRLGEEDTYSVGADITLNIFYSTINEVETAVNVVPSNTRRKRQNATD